MRSCTSAIFIGLGLILAAHTGAQAPVPWEVRTYIDTDWDPGELPGPGGFVPLTNYYPRLNANTPQATTESTVKEPYMCPACGYSTDAPGNCPNPWGVHAASVSLAPLPLAERFFHFIWMDSTLGPLFALVRGMPFRPGDPNPVQAPAPGPPPWPPTASNAQSRVRAALASANNTGAGPKFPKGAQVRFLLIPPGVARPTARYYDLTWTDAPGSPVGGDATGELFGYAGWISTTGELRIGVNPWRAVDGDWYQVRIRADLNMQDGFPDPANPGQWLEADGDYDDYHAADTQVPPRWAAARWDREYTKLQVQVWSDANGIEMDREFDTDETANPPYNVDLRAGTTAPRRLDLVCDSGAVRISLPLNSLDPAHPLPTPPGTYQGVLWWTFGFRICNAARILPGIGDGPAASFPPGEPILWEPPQIPAVTATPDVPFDTPNDCLELLRTNYTSPRNYWALRAPNAPVSDTDPTGDSGAGPVLTDATAEEFRLRPGEVGLGMVAALWRDPATAPDVNMWSYDESVDSEGRAQDFDDPAFTYAPTHPNGIQPIASRFFSSRVEVPRPAPSSLAELTTAVCNLPAGMPGGQTQSAYVDVRSRQVVGRPPVDAAAAQREKLQVVRCPPYIANTNGRDTGPAPNAFLDPYFLGSNGCFAGRGPSGDPTTDYTGAAGARVIGCGAVHRIWLVLSDPSNPKSPLITAPCWCGRRYLDNGGHWQYGHNPLRDPTTGQYLCPESMRCNYCGTVLRETEAVRTMAQPDEPPDLMVSHDLEEGEVPVDLGPGTDSAGQRPALGFVMAGEAGRRPQENVAAPQGVPGQSLLVYDPTAGVPPQWTANPPPATLAAAVQAPLFVDIPDFQLFSFAPGASGEFQNGAASPYQGAFVAYRAVDEKNPWFTDLTGTNHYPDPALNPASGDPAKRLFDRNGRWDIYYQCPDCGNKMTAAALGQDCNGAGCPGHQVCTTCGATWEAQGEGATATELQDMVLSHCPFCPGGPLPAHQPPALQPTKRVASDYLTAEEFDPVCVWAHVLRKTRLSAEQATVDLGRTAPGVTRADAFPLGVSPPVVGPAGNQGNYPVTQARTQGATTGVSAGDNLLAVTTSETETMSLTRDDVTTASETRSPVRIARSMPLTAQRLLAAIPNDAAQGWGGTIASGYRGAAGPQADMALLQAGGTSDGPVPNAIGTGSYAGTVLAFVDTIQGGISTDALDFLDRSRGLARYLDPPTNTIPICSTNTVFDPAEDVPLEPVVAIKTRLRVVESPLPYNDPNASDASAVPLFLASDTTTPLHDGMEVLWETNRLADGSTPNPDAAVNIVEAPASPATGPGIARDYTWPDPLPTPTAVTTDTANRAVNGTPEAYIDPANDLKWAFWHKLAPTPTDMGAVSQLWGTSNTGDLASAFDVANNAVVSDAALQQGFFRGFVDPYAGNTTANHWAFWHAGKRGQERIYYCADYDPAAKAAEDRVLPVSNKVDPSVKNDWVLVTVNGTTIRVRKPGKSPFTYAKDPAPVLEAEPGTGNPQVHVFFSGFSPQEGNSDICYARFNVAGMNGADRVDQNYGKVPLPRIVSVTPGWAEELRGDAARQTFISRHLDWLTTCRPPGATTGPDFIVAPAPGTEPQLSDPQIYVHLVYSGAPPANHTVLPVTWSANQTVSRYDRAKGIYRLGGLLFNSAAPPTPLGGRPVEMEVDPAAGTIRFTAPLFNPLLPSDAKAIFNTTNRAGLQDVQVWASYTPYVYRMCRDDANDDSPSAFFDYGGPGLASGFTDDAERAAVGRLVVFWRRSQGASDALHFGRTSFMYASLTSAIQVGHPPIDSAETTTVTDVTVTPTQAITPVGTAADDGIIGLPETPNRAGHLVRVTYTTRDGAAHTEYHTLQGLGAEQRVNVDTVFSEGPLVVRREWYTIPSLTVSGTASQPYVARYWLFWTSPRTWYDPAASAFRQSRDVYYAAIVPEFGTTEPVRNLPSQ